MYKKQMKFQRIVCIIMLASCALVFIYSLGLMTDIYNAVGTNNIQKDPADLGYGYGQVDKKTGEEYTFERYDKEYPEMTRDDPKYATRNDVAGARIYYYMQGFNGTLTILSIVLIGLALILFITCTNKRRKYYIANYVSVALMTGGTIGVSLWALPQIAKYKADWENVDFQKLYSVLEKKRLLKYYTDSNFWFDAGYVIFGILIVVNVLLIVNLVLKVILMKAEKQSIGTRKDVRA